jgi:hypothetical protein
MAFSIPIFVMNPKSFYKKGDSTQSTLDRKIALISQTLDEDQLYQTWSAPKMVLIFSHIQT